MCVNIQLPPAQLNQRMEPWACVPEVLGHLLFPSREAAGSGRLTTPHTASQQLGIIICHCTSCSEGPASLCNPGDHQFLPSLLQFCPFPAIGVRGGALHYPELRFHLRRLGSSPASCSGAVCTLAF